MKSLSRSKTFYFVFGIVFQCLLGSALALVFEQSDLDLIKKKYGTAAQQRFIAWQKLTNEVSGLSDLDKLKRVNDFFNQNTAFVEDKVQWQKEDYWATPSEFLARGAGDCEDYSIAKYFSLVEMGVDENKLRISYVTAVALNQAHMVLTYYATTDQTPLILDNLMPTILPATQRTDLVPVYSFNGSSLWLARSQASGTPDSNADRLSIWLDLKKRLTEIP